MKDITFPKFRGQDLTQEVNAWLASIMSRRDELLAYWLTTNGYTPDNAILCENTQIEEDGSITTRVYFERKDDKSEEEEGPPRVAIP